MPNKVAHVNSPAHRDTFSFLLPCVLVFYCCCHKLPQIWWLKQCRLIILELCMSEINTGRTGLNQGVSSAAFLVEALEENNPFICLFHLLEATPIPCLVVPFSIFEASNITFLRLYSCSQSPLTLSCLPLLLLRSLVITLGPPGKYIGSPPYFKVSWLAVLTPFATLILLCHVT